MTRGIGAVPRGLAVLGAIRFDSIDPRRKAAVAHYMPQVDQMIEEAEERADAELPPKLRLPLIRLKESPLT